MPLVEVAEGFVDMETSSRGSQLSTILSLKRLLLDGGFGYDSGHLVGVGFLLALTAARSNSSSWSCPGTGLGAWLEERGYTGVSQEWLSCRHWDEE